MEIQTKKLISLYLVFIFGLLSLIGFYLGKEIPNNFTTLCAAVISFYFGRGVDSSKDK